MRLRSNHKLRCHLPVVVLYDLRPEVSKQSKRFDLLRQRLRVLLAWAVPLAWTRLQIVEFRREGAESLVPGLLPEGWGSLERTVQVVRFNSGLSPLVDLSAPRALVCGGELERTLYPCHDLIRGGVMQVGLVPQLCGASGRSGELSRARTSSHLEHVLGVEVLGSVDAAARWLLPEGPLLQSRLKRDTAASDMSIVVQSLDNTELTEDQHFIISLLMPQDVYGIQLHKIGKGWTSALKFFCIPLVVEHQDAATTGATTFIKMGKAQDLEEELSITKFMMELLGGFCPQVLGYAEHGEQAAIHLSLADLSETAPKGLADLYQELMLPGKVESIEGPILLQRIVNAIRFVFGNLLARLHSAKKSDLPNFSIFDELGFCRDLPGGKTGVEEKGSHLSTSFLLEKLWRKSPGDGGLASSVRIQVAQLLGDDAASAASLRFLDGHPLQLPNVISGLLEQPDRLARLRDATSRNHKLCFVHGDLHGDNIMVDGRDNRFLIDFGKTGLGHCLEDVTYLESHVLLSYTEIATDEELSDCLDLVPLLAPGGSRGLSVAACDSKDMDEVGKRLSSPRLAAMWTVVRTLRRQLRRGICRLAAGTAGRHTEELHQAGLVAVLLLLRNSLFFMAARENATQPRRRRFALALACAYAETARAMVGGPATPAPAEPVAPAPVPAPAPPEMAR